MAGPSVGGVSDGGVGVGASGPGAGAGTSGAGAGPLTSLLAAAGSLVGALAKSLTWLLTLSWA